VVATPSAASAADPCGFVAEDIGAFCVAKTVFALKAKASNDVLFVGSTRDGMPVELASGGTGAARALLPADQPCRLQRQRCGSGSEIAVAARVR
jgi:hypothetical protein